MDFTKEEKNELMIGGLFAGIFVILGTVLLVWGIYRYSDLSNFLNVCKSTKGNIIEFIDLNKNRASERAFVLPKIKYVAPNEKEHEFLAGISIWDDYKIGTEVTVLYNPNKFSDAKIDTFADLYFIPILLLIIGFFFVFVPIFTIYRHIKSLKYKKE